MSSPETEWLAQALKGNDEAFSQLVETYQTPVFNLCYRMLGDPAEAEDAAQESFWRAYQSLQKYDPQRSFATWLLSIAAHYCIDQLRKRRMALVPMDLLPEEAAPDPTPGPESVSGRREEQRRLRRLLDKLDPPDRSAVVMRYWYDFSDAEIGEALGLTVSAVKSRLHRARRELAVQYQAVMAETASNPRRAHESPAF